MELIFWMISSLVRWVRLKIYQYEVTFAIYMLTPTEKFIFSMSHVPCYLSMPLANRRESFRDCRRSQNAGREREREREP